MQPMMQTDSLTKRFGDLLALDNMSLSVNKGDIYGFIGPNGAGKTTTFTILATILKPDSGSVTIDGIDIQQGDAIRPIIGYMPDSFGVYDDMTVFQYLDFFGAAYYIARDRRQQLIADILELTDLAFKRDAMVRSLSRGMQQRLGIARVLIHDPKLLILDEPASGLDPRARIELRELLKELTRMGKTILISSHILSELSEICNRVGIIESGRLVFEGTRHELNSRLISSGSITIETVPEDLDNALAILQQADFTAQATLVTSAISLRVKDNFCDIHHIPALLVQNSIRLTSFRHEQLSLENAFMTLTQGNLA